MKWITFVIFSCGMKQFCYVKKSTEISFTFAPFLIKISATFSWPINSKKSEIDFSTSLHSMNFNRLCCIKLYTRQYHIEQPNSMAYVPENDNEIWKSVFLTTQNTFLQLWLPRSWRPFSLHSFASYFTSTSAWVTNAFVIKSWTSRALPEK